MLSKLMCGAILASAAAGASAQTWNFTYTGFNVLYEPTGVRTFHPDVTISGNFSGTDRNGDGVLSAAELTSFTIQSPWINGTDFTRCAQDRTPNSGCSLDAFSFGPQDNLAFTVKWNRQTGNEAGLGYYGSLRSGATEWAVTYDKGDSFYSEEAWTPATTLTISPPPVPEPPLAGMTLTGLLALALGRLIAARRRLVQAK